MPDFSPKVKAEVCDRLKRIEGQARGVARMVEDGRDCREILNQLAAIRAAAHQASLILVRNYAHACLRDPDQSPEEALDDLVGMLSQLPL